MNHELRVKALLQKMQGNTASLAEIQAITDIDPLVVRAALVNLQKEGVVYFTGKEYGLMDYEEEQDRMHIYLEKADEYIGEAIKENFNKT